MLTLNNFKNKSFFLKASLRTFWLIILVFISIYTNSIEATKPIFKSQTNSVLNSPLGDNVVWIGAIRADSAHIPTGKRFLSWEMGTPEYKAVWKNIDSLSRKSIILRKSFVAKKEIKNAVTLMCMI